MPLKSFLNPLPSFRLHLLREREKPHRTRRHKEAYHDRYEDFSMPRHDKVRRRITKQHQVEYGKRRPDDHKALPLPPPLGLLAKPSGVVRVRLRESCDTSRHRKPQCDKTPPYVCAPSEGLAHVGSARFGIPPSASQAVNTR